MRREDNQMVEGKVANTASSGTSGKTAYSPSKTNPTEYSRCVILAALVLAISLLLRNVDFLK